MQVFTPIIPLAAVLKPVLTGVSVSLFTAFIYTSFTSFMSFTVFFIVLIPALGAIFAEAPVPVFTNISLTR